MTYKVNNPGALFRARNSDIYASAKVGAWVSATVVAATAVIASALAIAILQGAPLGGGLQNVVGQLRPDQWYMIATGAGLFTIATAVGLRALYKSNHTELKQTVEAPQGLATFLHDGTYAYEAQEGRHVLFYKENGELKQKVFATLEHLQDAVYRFDKQGFTDGTVAFAVANRPAHIPPMPRDDAAIRQWLMNYHGDHWNAIQGGASELFVDGIRLFVTNFHGRVHIYQNARDQQCHCEAIEAHARYGRFLEARELFRTRNNWYVDRNRVVYRELPGGDFTVINSQLAPNRYRSHFVEPKLRGAELPTLSGVAARLGDGYHVTGTFLDRFHYHIQDGTRRFHFDPQERHVDPQMQIPTWIAVHELYEANQWMAIDDYFVQNVEGQLVRLTDEPTVGEQVTSISRDSVNLIKDTPEGEARLAALYAQGLVPQEGRQCALDVITHTGIESLTGKLVMPAPGTHDLLFVYTVREGEIGDIELINSNTPVEGVVVIRHGLNNGIKQQYTTAHGIAPDALFRDEEHCLIMDIVGGQKIAYHEPSDTYQVLAADVAPLWAPMNLREAPGQYTPEFFDVLRPGADVAPLWAPLNIMEAPGQYAPELLHPVGPRDSLERRRSILPYNSFEHRVFGKNTAREHRVIIVHDKILFFVSKPALAAYEAEHLDGYTFSNMPSAVVRALHGQEDNIYVEHEHMFYALEDGKLVQASEVQAGWQPLRPS